MDNNFLCDLGVLGLKSELWKCSYGKKHSYALCTDHHHTERACDFQLDDEYTVMAQRANDLVGRHLGEGCMRKGMTDTS